MSESYPEQPLWETGELDSDDIEYVRERARYARGVTFALNELAEGLEQGESRTAYDIPINKGGRDPVRAMIAGANDLGEAIDAMDGVEGLTEEGAPYDLRENQPPEQYSLDEYQPSPGMKAAIFRDYPVGYLHVAHTENGLEASVGCLDFQDQTHYSVPL